MGNHRKGFVRAHAGGYVGWKFNGGFLGVLEMEDGFRLFAGPSCFHALRGESEEQAAANAARLAAGWNLLETLEREGEVPEVLEAAVQYPPGEVGHNENDDALLRIAAAVRTALEGKP